MPDIGLELAAMDVECPDHVESVLEDWPVGTVCHCNGTGRVPRFPGVRVACTQPHWVWVNPRIDGAGMRKATCEEMECQGYTVSDRLEDWMEYLPEDCYLMREDGKWLILHDQTQWYDDWGFDEYGEGSTPLEALQQALLKVVTV